jgi:hypothetical protein
MYGKQVDDHVQSSTMGAVKPMPEHPHGDRLVPVSAAIPDAEPKAERKLPPYNTGHDIASNTPESVRQEREGNQLPSSEDKPLEDAESAADVIATNAAGAKKNDEQAIKEGRLDEEVALSDPPFPRATKELPVQSVTGPENAATLDKLS